MTFETLTIPDKDTVVSGRNYRVYKNAGEFVVVSASTALEAFATSGVENIHRIDLESIDGNNVLDPKLSTEVLLKKKEAAPAEAAAAPAEPAAAAPAEAPAAAEAPKA